MAQRRHINGATPRILSFFGFPWTVQTPKLATMSRLIPLALVSVAFAISPISASQPHGYNELWGGWGKQAEGSSEAIRGAFDALRAAKQRASETNATDSDREKVRLAEAAFDWAKAAYNGVWLTWAVAHTNDEGEGIEIFVSDGESSIRFIVVEKELLELKETIDSALAGLRRRTEETKPSD